MTSLRRQFVQKDLSFSTSLQNIKKESHSPTSTNDSSSPRDHSNTYTKSSFRQNKEKSQLCKKFVENGFCPYQKKCKFAHGSHELKKNCQANIKYKTKECGVFINEGCCMYGNRCNFIHQNDYKIDKSNLIDLGFIEVKTGVRSQSRLLALLNE